MLALLALLALASPSAGERVFMAPVRAEGVAPAARVAVEEALLNAVRARNPNVVGSSDVAALLDAEAAIQAAGCDTAGCDAELADALGAPELLSAQLVRVEPTTWVMTLKRLRRADMHVLASHQVSRTGESPMVMVGGLDELADVVVGARVARVADAGGGPLPAVAAVTAGTGAVAGVVGGVMMVGGLLKFNDGTAALAEGDVQGAYEIRRDYEWLTPTGLAVVIGGGALVVVGAAVFGVDALIGAAP